MKFIVTRRDSDHYLIEKPCEGAVLEKDIIDRFGEHHCIWSLEVNSIQDLLDLKETVTIDGSMHFMHPYTDEFNSYPELELGDYSDWMYGND